MKIPTTEQVTAEFLTEFRALLQKYGAEITADDHFIGYAECGEDIRMTVDIPCVYDANHDYIRQRAEIDLGRHFNGDTP